MKLHTLFFSSLIASLTFLSGCSEDTDSEDIETSGIYAAMNIDVDSDTQSTIDVELRVGGSGSRTYVNLTSGDTLTATLNDSETITLSKKSVALDDKISYRGTFTGTTAGTENSIIKVSFNRPSKTSAPNSNITIPAPITEFTSDVNTFDRSQDSLVLSWDAAGNNDDLKLTYQGGCIIDGSNTVVDTGSYTINAGTIKNALVLDPAESCSIDFYISRATTGEIDPAYGEGGYIKIRQIRSIAVTSAP